MSLGHPPAEIAIDEVLVRGLLAEQFPEHASGSLELVGEGWDNVIYRLDRQFSIRLPRREVAAQLIRNEQRCLTLLAPRLPLPVPVPIHAGRPGAGYPWPWSICQWFDGERASASPPADLHEAAETLAAFVNALHVPAPDDAPVNAVRGGPQSDRIERITKRIVDVGAAGRLLGHDAAGLVVRYRALASAPEWLGPAVWLHGDLHASNLLTRNGRLSAVIDFGDITSGDPATDLAVAWIVLDEPARGHFRRLVDRDEATWTRAQAWALSFAVFYLDSAGTDSVMGLMGERTLAQVLAS
ncbi:MAG: aminoglycoside phosphotransferase family protein [Acidimicrobiales bacterium]|nr:aminoglycoside phosphotransferase family protein [Acidimicrobiales bacterium]